MIADLYQRPSRDEIAARVKAAGDDDLDDVATRTDPGPDATRNFTMHLSACMRALGWDQKQLEERTGISAHVAGRAVNGTSVTLDLAAKLAGLVGLDLAAMISPYTCHTCAGQPPAGFGCLECGAEARTAAPKAGAR